MNRSDNVYGWRLSIVLGIVLLQAGCATNPMRVSLSPTELVVAPGDPVYAAASLNYLLSEAAYVDLSAMDAAGNHYVIRPAELRPTGGAYTFTFDGRIGASEAASIRKPLAPGTYRLTLHATGLGGGRSEASSQLIVQGSVSSPPEVTDVKAMPVPAPMLTIIDVDWGAGPLFVGQSLPVRVRVQNVGAQRLEAGSSSPLSEAVRSTFGADRARANSRWSVGLRLVDGRQSTSREFWRPGGGDDAGSEAPLSSYAVRLPVSQSVEPNQAIDLRGELQLPAEPGNYALSAGLIQDPVRLVEHDRARQVVEVRP